MDSWGHSPVHDDVKQEAVPIPSGQSGLIKMAILNTFWFLRLPSVLRSQLTKYSHVWYRSNRKEARNAMEKESLIHVESDARIIAKCKL